MDELAQAVEGQRTDPPPDREPFLRCPACGSIDWERDGLRVLGAEVDGEIHRFRVAPTTEGTARLPWTCGNCDHMMAPDSDLGVELRVANLTHVE